MEILFTALILIVVSAESHAPHSLLTPRHTPLVAAVQRTSLSVVAVRFPRPGRSDAVGTGVVIDSRGYIVTNHHVVGGARTVSVCLEDGTELPARVLVVEADTDLAILLIKSEGGIDRKLPALPLARTCDLMVGEQVIAVGNPFGYQHTVSTGIVSALGRQITMPTGAVLTGLIQTDASINPGNSGGPLLNIDGEMIGLVVALREGAHGIAWAINADAVRSMIRRHVPPQ
jgi:serine protease Do